MGWPGRSSRKLNQEAHNYLLTSEPGGGAGHRRRSTDSRCCWRGCEWASLEPGHGLSSLVQTRTRVLSFSARSLKLAGAGLPALQQAKLLGGGALWSAWCRVTEVV